MVSFELSLLYNFMIINFILQAFNNLLYGLFGLLPLASDLTATVYPAMDTVLSNIGGIGWLLPMDTLIQVVILTFVAIELPIFSYKIGIRVFGMVRGGGSKA